MRYKTALRSFFSDTFALATFKLIAVWLIGLMLGGYLADKASPFFGSSFLLASAKGCTFLQAVLVLAIPLLTSVCLGYLFSADAVLVIVFLKAAVFSLVAVACVFNCAGAGWVVSRLLMFSEFLGMPVLLWVCHSILCGTLHKTQVLVSFLLILVICLADYLIISPFLCSLF